MGSFPRYVLLFLFPTCLASGCSLNDDSLTGEEQALCFLTLLRHYRERLNGANREEQLSLENLDSSNEESNDFPSDEDDVMFDAQDLVTKRGKLDQNFLRFGRFPLQSPSTDKRAALDRNFLRFGRNVDHARNKRAAEVATGSGVPYTNYKSDVPTQRSLHLVKGMLSPEKIHLMRELSRKRGALERNFLRFGRSGEVQEEDHLHQLEKRAALDRNFLRFGRRDIYDKKAALDRNFLRFGRNPNAHHHEDGEGYYPEMKRAALDRNFLRFGKSEAASFRDASLHNGEKDDSIKRAALDRNFLRFGRDPMTHEPLAEAKRAALDRNFLRFGKRNWPKEASEDDDDSEEFVSEDKRYELARDLVSALHQKRDVNHQMSPTLRENGAEEDEIDSMDPQAKRGALDKNFLRFGRRQYDISQSSNRSRYPSLADSAKRAALDRNFLRFGKRNEMDDRLDKKTLPESNSQPHVGHDEDSNVTMALSH